MGGKTKRKFALEIVRDQSPATRHHTCRICRKRFRWTVQLDEEEEYDGDDEREVRQRKPVSCWWAGGLKVWEVYEPDEWEPPCQRKKEKGAALAQPDPWGPSTADEDYLSSLGLLVTTDIDGWSPGPLPDNLNLDRKADDRCSL